MNTLRERRSVQIAIVLACTLLIALTVVMQAALQDAHAMLDQRQKNVLAVRSLQKMCAVGELPSEAELVAVATLFPDARLTCSRIDEVVYLTFEDESAPMSRSLVVMQER